jgi:predicted metal-binding membrane protein
MTVAAEAIGRRRTGPRAPTAVVVAVAAAWAISIAAAATGRERLLHQHALIEHGPPLWAAALLFIVAWQAMIAAMMLPSSLPLIRHFAVAARGQAHSDRMIAVFLGGYAVVWTSFGVVAFLGDVGVHRATHATPWIADRPWLLGGGTLLIAGAFQFSGLKDRCLAKCRHPGFYLLTHYRRGAGGAFSLGVGHGVFCLGCCWALMLVMFGLGVAVLWWMAALTALMIYEKTGRHGAAVVRPVGVLLLGAAVLQLAHPTWLPSALGGPRVFASSIGVGPGPVTRVIRAGGYELELGFSPNRASQAGRLSLRLLNTGRPVNGARIRATFTMLDMDMPGVSIWLRQTGPGAYARRGPVLGMSGRWGLRLAIVPPHGKPLEARIVDRLAP